MVHLPGVAALDDEPHPCPLLLAHEMVVHSGGEKQRRDRGAGGARVAVRQHDDVGTERDRLRYLPADLVDGGFESRPTFAHREQAVDSKAAEAGRLPVLVDVEQLGQVVVVDDRVRQADLPARGRLRLEQVPLRSDCGLEGGHELFPDGIERGVRHLREELGEVVVHEARPLGEHGEGRIGAHGADGLAPGPGHGLDDEAQLLVGHSEEPLMPHDRGVLGSQHHPGRQIPEMDEALGQPVPIGMLGGQGGLYLVIGDDAPGCGVDEEHPSRLQPALDDDRGRVEVKDTHLRCEHDEPVVGHPVAGGAQAVAVEHGPHHGPVGEGDGRGPVPGLHQRRVEAVERSPRRVHLGVVLPGLGDHHEHRMSKRPAAEMEQLQHLVEGGRIACSGRHDREDPSQVAVEAITRQERLSRAHPIPVTRECVDLAVVRDEAVRVSERPRGKRVGREPGMHEHQPALEPLVGEIREEPSQLLGRQHPLVDDRPCRQRREVDAHVCMLDALAHHKALTLEGIADQRGPGTCGGGRCGPVRGGEEDLREPRRDGPGSLAGRGEVDRHLAPSEDLKAFLARDL